VNPPSNRKRSTGNPLPTARAPVLDPTEVKHLRGLTLGETLSLEIAILRKQISTFETSPALVAILVASLLSIDYRSHRSLLLPSFAFIFVMAKDGEVACWFQPFVVSSLYLSGADIETKWPTR
jgi:hypothetical protein